MIRKGSLLVEALIAILIIGMAIGISLVSSYNILKKAYENRIILNMSELLLNKCEEIVTLNQSQIFEGTTSINYKGQEYKITIGKNVVTLTDINYRYFNYNPNTNQYTPTQKDPQIVNSPIIVVTVKITDSKGRYVETKVVPQQW
ncbi:MAG TPA: hypothetical protein PK390_04055 [Fervidobacterium nodosum]|nr:hypothetical protein [Fervidobacterium nodosum]